MSFAFNKNAEGALEGHARDIIVDLPPGLVGDPLAMPRCSDKAFYELIVSACPGDTQVGVLYVEIPGLGRVGPLSLSNLTPPNGIAARFGFVINGLKVLEDATVRTGQGYGVEFTTDNISVPELATVSETVWGVPAAHAHDPERICGESGSVTPGCSTNAAPQPFLTLPTSCEAPLESTLRTISTEGQEATVSGVSVDGGGNPSVLSGCERLAFTPFTTLAPDTQEASTPSGLTVHVKVPQTGALNPEGLADSDVENTTVALPAGVAINPAGANGLEACSEAQIGYLPGQSAPPGDLRFTPAAPSCPLGSKIATVKITTPLLENALEGAVYLAEPAPNGEAGKNPFASLIALYIVAQDPVSGVLVKLPGQSVLDPVTGQITTTFLDTPPLPFEDLELHFFGGERAPLAMPASCGTYTSHAVFTPWSGAALVDSASGFQILTGVAGGGCVDPLPFAPSLAAGMASVQAGGYSPFTMTMGREDGNQNLKSIQLHVPPGLSAMLTGVPLCGEAQADAGTCSAASLIGETTVSVGLGGDPYTVKGGQVFLTGPYEGAPFGLSIVNPAVAGPFNLGKVVVRAKIEVDPTTTAVTVTSDSSGPYAIPPSIDGIPLEIKHVNVTITGAGGRNNFTYNPTSCDPHEITGALQSIEGASSSIAIPFQVTNCAALKFEPKFTAATSAKTSKAGGASLTLKVTRSSGPASDQANFAAAKIDLPKQLPSRLTTLQKACTAAQFDADPAGCPAASDIGHVKVQTPILPVPLEGPAYFVSHGGEAFPSVIFVLQGDNVTVDVVSTTFISKTGITSATLKAVPDAPFTSFELTFPEGKYSALAANGNLCESKLEMPTLFVAQNGAEIHQSTPIGVTGCPKARKAKKRHKKAKGHSKRSK